MSKKDLVEKIFGNSIPKNDQTNPAVIERAKFLNRAIAYAASTEAIGRPGLIGPEHFAQSRDLARLVFGTATSREASSEVAIPDSSSEPTTPDSAQQIVDHPLS